MLISKYIAELLPDELYSVDNEQEIEGLGLNNYGPNRPYCCFAMKEAFLQTLSEYVVEVITIPELKEDVLARGLGCICVKDPKNAFFMLHNILCEKKEYAGLLESTTIGKDSEISDRAIISPVGVKIGQRVVIEENVIIRDNAEIGDDTIIRAGTIVGAQELEVKKRNNTTYRIQHLGKVLIGNNVEIGYNNVVDRAVYPWDVTQIGNYVQTSQNVIIGHGTKLEDRILVSAGAIVGGRTHVCEDVWIGPGAVISNGLDLGPRSYISIGSCVLKNVEADTKVFGNPARKMPI